MFSRRFPSQRRVHVFVTQISLEGAARSWWGGGLRSRRPNIGSNYCASFVWMRAEFPSGRSFFQTPCFLAMHVATDCGQILQ